MKLTPDQIDAARACGCEFVPATPSEVQRLTMQRRIFYIGNQPVLATRNGSYFETVGTLTQMVENHLHDTIRHASAVDSKPASIPAAAGDRALVAEPTSAVPASAVVSEPNREVVLGNPPPSTAAPSGVMVSVEDEATKGVEATPEAGPDAGTPAQPKRGRGRPRKHPVAPSDGQTVSLPSERSTSAAEARRRRGPGRPKKKASMLMDKAEVFVSDDELASTVHGLANATSDSDEVPTHQTAASPRLPRVRGPKLPRWMIAGMVRRGRLK